MTMTATVSGNTTPTMSAMNNSNNNNNGATATASTTSTTTGNGSGQQHWSQKKHESVLDVSHLSQLELEKCFLSKLSGGSDNGQFVAFTPNSATTAADKSASSANLKYLTQSRILDGEILLEVEENRVSGYTLYDVIDLVLKLYRTQKAIRFR